MDVPEDYVVSKIQLHTSKFTHHRYNRTYQFGCPICHEGKSWNKKARGYYLVEDNVMCCHNCGFFGDPIKWVMEVEGISFKKIVSEIKENDYGYITEKDIESTTITHVTNTLPQNCINLNDKIQVRYHRREKTVQHALDYIKERRLDTAINRPRTFWLSLTDPVHKNRLVIPFYGPNREITYYQTRKILDDDSVSYLSKMNDEKSLYGLDRLDPKIGHVFIFEGPIDAMFVRNGIAVAGIQVKNPEMYTGKQKKQSRHLLIYKQVIVLDSQWKDKTSYDKSEVLIDNGMKVFIWPKSIGTKYKDFNEMCVKNKKDEILVDFVLENTFSGMSAKLELGKIPKPC